MVPSPLLSFSTIILRRRRTCRSPDRSECLIDAALVHAKDIGEYLLRHASALVQIRGADFLF
jgi:hypothetical protein